MTSYCTCSTLCTLSGSPCCIEILTYYRIYNVELIQKILATIYELSPCGLMRLVQSPQHSSLCDKCINNGGTNHDR